MPLQEIGPGTRIGKYEVLVHVATGGMSKVYKARDTILNRVVALKVLTIDLAVKPAALERFRREARHAARLSHRNLVSLYEVGEDNGIHYLALEYAEGVDLYEYIERKGKLPPEEARRILVQAARALDHFYRNDIVHRDVKPSNFLLTAEQGRLRVKLTDFGLARTVREDEEFRVTRAGSTVGTIDYLSPEQARDSAAADIRSDIYSLGCTFYHMLSGQPPFAEGGLGERIYKHQAVEPTDIRQFNPDVSEEMWLVLQKMLAKEPTERQQTPEQLLAELKGLSGSAGTIEAISPDTLQPRHELLDTSRDDDSDWDPTPMPSSPGSSMETQAAPPSPSPDETKKPPSSGSHTYKVRDNPKLLGITPDQAEAAAAQFDRACQAANQNSLDYALDLLFTSCRLDPLTPLYRKKLREVGRLIVRRKGTGGWLSRWLARRNFRVARRSGDVRRILESGEKLLMRNPADIRTHMEMAEECVRSGLRWLAIWILEQGRVHGPVHVQLLRTLATHYESAREMQQAIHIWEQIREAAPNDLEVSRKLHALAVNYTIDRARYRSSES
jgi:serine/threonine-protein kinase